VAKIKLPQVIRATRTEDAIEAAIAADGGARFRELQRKWLPLIEDAYRGAEEDEFRSHLGASQIGRKCAREVWLGYRWAVKKRFKPRMLRLVNRGHLEEARFLSLLEMIGCHFHMPEGGGQDRISDHGGHYGSALDATLWGVPDCPGEWILGEFKTHNTKSFCKLVVEGVKASKPEHFDQMQSCMGRRGIHKTLYLAVNKNDDDLFAQIIDYEHPHEQGIRDKASDIITRRSPPKRISDDPSHFDCTFCDAFQRCHHPGESQVFKNCRTCRHSIADIPSGTWGCERFNMMLDKPMQLKGCDDWDPIPELTAR
jgi:hypothetical protein